MDGIENNTATCYLPHDIIENILCRLPVKSLLRFRCVCKQWKATISDPKVARTHLRLSKNSSSSSSSCLLNLFGYKAAVEHVDFAKDEFRLVSSIDYPSVKDPDTGILCHCDGLYLIPCLLDHPSARARDYALWNPSRRSYKKLNGCPIIDKYVTWISGICYDPLVKDYKVVIGEGNSYAVFNCGNNCWSELKEMTNIDMEESTGWRGNHAVSYNGSVYWICYSVKEHDRLKIVYFDGRDEEFKNLCKLDVGAEVAQMISLEDEGLCLFTYYKFRGCWRSREMVFMKKLVNGVGEEEWKEEVKVELPAYDYRSWRCVWPVCCTHGNKIVVRLEYSHSGQDYLLYDVTKRSFATIQNAPPDSLNYYNMFPYVENLATFA